MNIDLPLPRKKPVFVARTLLTEDELAVWEDRLSTIRVKGDQIKRELKSFTDEQYKIIYEAADDGVPIQMIAKGLGISRQAIHDIGKRPGRKKVKQNKFEEYA